MRRFVLALAACCGLGAILAADAGNEPQLLYAVVNSDNVDIMWANADGSGAVNITKHASKNTYPAYSPDGKKIAFVSDRDGKLSVYVMDADGKNIKRLTEATVEDRQPAWSPDGKKIAFARKVTERNEEIFIMNADGSDPVNLTNDPTFNADPAWSPDGKRIAFTSARGGQGFRLYVMNAGGGDAKEVPTPQTPWGFVYPAWSPDSKRIAYAAKVNAERDLEIVVCDIDGGNAKQLTSLGGWNIRPAWSPDGKKIAFQHSKEKQFTGTGSLYVMDADGSNAKELVSDGIPIAGGRPAWRPKSN